MARHKDANWDLPEGDLTWNTAFAALLMDLRDELRHLNIRLDCRETLSIPRTLLRIARNTTKKRKK